MKLELVAVRVLHAGENQRVKVRGYMVLYKTVTVFFLSNALRKRRTGWVFTCCRVDTEMVGWTGVCSGGLAPPTWVCCGHEGERWAEPSVLPAWMAQSGPWGRTRCFLWASSWLWFSGKESKVDKEEEGGWWNPAVAGWKSQLVKSLVDNSSLSSLASEAERFMIEGGVSPACLIRASISMALCHIAGALCSNRCSPCIEFCLPSGDWFSLTCPVHNSSPPASYKNAWSSWRVSWIFCKSSLLCASRTWGLNGSSTSVSSSVTPSSHNREEEPELGSRVGFKVIWSASTETLPSRYNEKEGSGIIPESSSSSFPSGTFWGSVQVRAAVPSGLLECSSEQSKHGEGRGDREEGTSWPWRSMSSNCSVARRTDPEGLSVGEWGTEAVSSSTSSSVAVWCELCASGRLQVCDMDSSSVTIWRTHTLLSLWGRWGMHSLLVSEWAGH